jgi:hypothetical protein
VNSSSVILPCRTEITEILQIFRQKNLFIGATDKEAGKDRQKDASVPNRSLSVSQDCLLKDELFLHWIIHFY